MLALISHLPTSPYIRLRTYPLFFSAKQPRRLRKPPQHARGKRTRRRLRGHCPHICSSVKIGARGSRQRTLTPVLVSCVVVMTSNGSRYYIQARLANCLVPSGRN